MTSEQPVPYRVGSSSEGSTGSYIGGGDRHISTDPVRYGDPEKRRGVSIDWDEIRRAHDERAAAERVAYPPAPGRYDVGWFTQPTPETGEEVEAPHTTDASEAPLAGDDHPSPSNLPNLVREEGAGGPTRGEAARPPAPAALTDIRCEVARARAALELAQDALERAEQLLVAASQPPPAPPAPTRAPRKASTRPRAPRTTVDRADVLRRYADGATVGAIAAALGCGNATVRRILIGNGVTLRDDRQTNSGHVRAVRTPQMLEDVRRLYVDERLSVSTVARRLGVGNNTVLRAMRDAGIEGRRGQSGRADGSAALKARMAELNVTSADVRAWARAEGLEVTVRGLPTSALVEQYAAAHVDGAR